ncbi:putative Alanine aminotransferase [Giardia muris]|uniref:Putative Alanine aminotransferase n=1 Tax=Giardia muris TaxID=5742 RepID=A0A4Z1T648_GIAMU|nr:putative Alanine aminotransferase [Giardia muris]|eukprot:TNJ27931.1 putative Alanine aminotransferase [Giardia muris]
MPYEHVLTLSRCYPCLADVHFQMVNFDVSAVEERIRKKEAPFSQLVRCNLGNPQAVGQPSISYLRQMIAAVACPELIGKYVLPKDVELRAQHILKGCPGKSSGSYQETYGNPAVVEDVAAFISERDGYTCSVSSVCMSNGATEALMLILRAIIRGKEDAILCPSPGFPLYNASITYFGGTEVRYYLDESEDWALTDAALDEALEACTKAGLTPRCLVVINPNNPTGSVLTEKNIESALRYAYTHNMLVIADEVYQLNVYEPERLPFVSCRKVLKTLEASGDCVGLELISVNSASKSIHGECGRRGGYWQVENVDEAVFGRLLDIVSLGSTNTDGMVALDVMVNPPRPLEPSHRRFRQEYDTVYSSLQRKARVIAEEMGKWRRLSCRKPVGAMYVFPSIDMPAAALEAARTAGMEPDQMYCNDLLNAVGVLTLPGCMFGQREGSYHLRMTILPPEDMVNDILKKWETFHREWMDKYDPLPESQ